MTPTPLVSQVKGKSQDINCLKCVVKGHIARQCPIRHVNILMRNDYDSNELVDENIEMEARNAEIP